MEKGKLLNDIPKEEEMEKIKRNKKKITTGIISIVSVVLIVIIGGKMD